MLTHVEALFKKHKLNATERGIPFELDPALHARLVGADCAYCGAPPAERPHPYLRVRIKSNTIDRIDSRLGYTESNCNPACATCNTAKMAMGFDEFRDWVARVYRHLHE